MDHVVTALFVAQALAGAALLVRWWRHGRHSTRRVVTHVSTNLAALAVWIVFVATGGLVWAWLAFGVLTIGNGFGDGLMLTRARRMTGRSEGFRRDYATAVGMVFRGEMPRLVVFHALFSAAVYFTCLGVCVGATVAAAT